MLQTIIRPKPLLIWLLFVGMLLAQLPLQCGESLYAQPINTPKTVVIEQLLLSADSLQTSDINQAIVQAEKALDLAKKYRLEEEKLRAYTALGSLYSTLQKYPQSETYYSMALEKSRQQQNQKGELLALIGWAGILERKGEYSKSLEELLKANALAHQLKDSIQAGRINASIAHIYFNYEEFEEAITFLNKAKHIYQASNNLKNLAALHNNIALVQKMSGQLDSAKQNFLEAIELGKILNNEVGNLQTYNNIALMYLTENELDTCEFYLLKSLDLAKKLEVESMFTYYNLARLYLEKQDFLKGERNALISLKMSEQDNMNVEIIKNKMLLAGIYAAQGNYQSAYQHQKELDSIKNKLFESDISSEVELIENKYQLQQKEMRLMEMDKEYQERKYVGIGVLAFLLFGIAFGFLYYRQNSLKNKKERLLLEQRLLRSQMNPHFIFNALSVIQGFIFKNNPKDAGRYLAKFSMLIRMILENSRKEYIPLDQEITALEYYLELQQLRFRDKFDFKIQIDEGIFPEQIVIAPMLTQPFIENAIEHGIQHKEGKGMLRMNFEMKKDVLLFTLEDDGVGRTFASTVQTKKRKHQSLSTQITKERLLLYQQKKNRSFRLAISDRMNRQAAIIGTKVSIQIPYKYF